MQESSGGVVCKRKRNTREEGEPIEEEKKGEFPRKNRTLGNYDKGCRRIGISMITVCIKGWDREKVGTKARD